VPRLLNTLLARISALSDLHARYLLCAVVARECGWHAEHLDTDLLDEVKAFLEAACKCTEGTAPHRPVVALELIALFWRPPIVAEGRNSGVHYVVQRLTEDSAWMQSLQTALKQCLEVPKRPKEELLSLASNLLRVAKWFKGFRCFATAAILDLAFKVDRTRKAQGLCVEEAQPSPSTQLLDQVLCQLYAFLQQRHHNLADAVEDLLERFHRHQDPRCLSAMPHLLFATTCLQPNRASSLLSSFHGLALKDTATAPTRQAALLFAGGFAGRLPGHACRDAIHTTLRAIAVWANEYADRERRRPQDRRPLWEAHPIFYHAAQALLDALGRQGPLLMRDPRCVEEYHLAHLLVSRLNPLQYIDAAVTAAFCAEADILCQRQPRILPHRQVLQRNMGKALTSPEEYFKRLQRQNADLHRRLGLRFDPLAPCHLREFEQRIAPHFTSGNAFGYGAPSPSAGGVPKGGGTPMARRVSH
jgi:hypothetical protein